MAARTRHLRLSALACGMYRLLIWAYPAAFRRAFGRELVVTFRNQAEDALNGGVLTSLAFAAHMAGDWWGTWAVLAFDRKHSERRSLLGLHADGAHAYGCIDRPLVDASFLLAAAGAVLMVVGWYVFVATTTTPSGIVVRLP